MLECKQFKEEDKEIIVYGILSAVELGINMSTMLIIGIYFGLLLESIVFLLAFSFIRMYAGGYHCKEPVYCYLCSNIIVAMVLWEIKNITFRPIQLSEIALVIFAIFVISKYAPVQSRNRILDEKEKLYYRKKVVVNLVVESALICFLLLMNLYSLAYMICSAIIISACLVFLGKVKQ